MQIPDCIGDMPLSTEDKEGYHLIQYLWTHHAEYPHQKLAAGP